MDNTSEAFINFTSPLSSCLMNCLTEQSFGIIVSLSMMVLCMFVGIPAHLWCLRSYLHFDFNSKQSAIFFLNHTIMDFLFCAECTLDLMNIFFSTKNSLKVDHFLFGLSWTGRLLIQTCICIEQYMAVLHPVMFLRYKGIKYRITAVALAWLIAFTYGLHEAMQVMLEDPVINALLFITLAIISFCSVSVMHALTQSGPCDTHVTQQRGRDASNQQKKNASDMIVLALLIIFLTYLPHLIITIWALVNINKKMFCCNILPFMNSLTYGAVMISPILKIYRGI